MMAWLLAVVVVTVTVLSANIRSDHDHVSEPSDSFSSSVPTDTEQERHVHLQEGVRGQHHLPLALTSEWVHPCLEVVDDHALYHHVFISTLPDEALYDHFRGLCRRLDHSPALRARFNAMPDAHLICCIDRLPLMELGPHFDFVQQLPVTATFRHSFESLYDTLKFGRRRIFRQYLDFLSSDPEADDSQWKAIIAAELHRLLPGDVPEIVRNGLADRSSLSSADVADLFASHDAFDILLRPDVLSGLMRFDGRRLDLRDLLRCRDVPEPDLLALLPLLRTFWGKNGQSDLFWILASFLRQLDASLAESLWRMAPVADHVHFQLRRQLPLVDDMRASDIYGLIMETRCPFLSDLLPSVYDADTGDTHLHRICQLAHTFNVYRIVPAPSSTGGGLRFNPLLTVDLSVRNAAGRVPFQYASGSTLRFVQTRNPDLWRRVQQSLPPSSDGLLAIYQARSVRPAQGSAIWAAVVLALPGIDQVVQERPRLRLPELSAEATAFVEEFAAKLRSGGPDTVEKRVWTATDFAAGDGRRLSLPHGNTLLHYLFASDTDADLCNLICNYIYTCDRGHCPDWFFGANGDGLLPRAYLSDAVLVGLLCLNGCQPFVRFLVKADPVGVISALRRILINGDDLSWIPQSLNLLFQCADRIPSLSRPAPSALYDVDGLGASPSVRPAVTSSLRTNLWLSWIPQSMKELFQCVDRIRSLSHPAPSAAGPLSEAEHVPDWSSSAPPSATSSPSSPETFRERAQAPVSSS